MSTGQLTDIDDEIEQQQQQHQGFYGPPAVVRSSHLINTWKKNK